MAKRKITTGTEIMLLEREQRRLQEWQQLGCPEPFQIAKWKSAAEGLEEAHKYLDKLGIPRAERAECNDPECKTLLIHRIKHYIRVDEPRELPY